MKAEPNYSYPPVGRNLTHSYPPIEGGKQQKLVKPGDLSKLKPVTLKAAKAGAKAKAKAKAKAHPKGKAKAKAKAHPKGKAKAKAAPKAAATPGWKIIEHIRGPNDKHAGDKYWVYISPAGEKCRSLKAAKAKGFAG